MKERGGGNIINVSSVEGFMIGDKASVYDITKARLTHFTRIAGKEWAKYKIRMNAIAPSFTQTRLVHSMRKTPNIVIQL